MQQMCLDFSISLPPRPEAMDEDQEHMLFQLPTDGHPLVASGSSSRSLGQLIVDDGEASVLGADFFPRAAPSSGTERRFAHRIQVFDIINENMGPDSELVRELLSLESRCVFADLVKEAESVDMPLQRFMGSDETELGCLRLVARMEHSRLVDSSSILFGLMCVADKFRAPQRQTYMHLTSDSMPAHVDRPSQQLDNDDNVQVLFRLHVGGDAKAVGTLFGPHPDGQYDYERASKDVTKFAVDRFAECQLVVTGPLQVLVGPVTDFTARGRQHHGMMHLASEPYLPAGRVLCFNDKSQLRSFAKEQECSNPESILLEWVQPASKVEPMVAEARGLLEGLVYDKRSLARCSLKTPSTSVAALAALCELKSCSYFRPGNVKFADSLPCVVHGCGRTQVSRTPGKCGDMCRMHRNIHHKGENQRLVEFLREVASGDVEVKHVIKVGDWGARRGPQKKVVTTERNHTSSGVIDVLSSELLTAFNLWLVKEALSSDAVSACSFGTRIGIFADRTRKTGEERVPGITSGGAWRNARMWRLNLKVIHAHFVEKEGEGE